MVATARDLALYAVALRDGRLLSSQSMEFMTEWSPADERWQVGHNLFRHQYPEGLAIVGHYGDVLGFTAALYWVEGTDTVVAVLCNVGAMHSGEVPGTAYSVAEKMELIDLAVRVAASNSRVLQRVAGVMPPNIELFAVPKIHRIIDLALVARWWSNREHR